MKTQTIDFLLKNGFEKFDSNTYFNNDCKIIINKNYYSIEDINDHKMHSETLNFYWLVGYLTYCNFIPKNYIK